MMKLRLVVDLQTCAKAQLSRAYARKVKLSNLQQMAQTICFAQENGFDVREDVAAEIGKVSATMDTLKSRMKDNDARISALNQQIHFAGQLYINRNISAPADAIQSAPAAIWCSSGVITRKLITY